MKIDEFDAPEISFAIEFKKDMNFNINNLKNEIDLSCAAQERMKGEERDKERERFQRSSVVKCRDLV